jgi:hypothetical protein
VPTGTSRSLKTLNWKKTCVLFWTTSHCLVFKFTCNTNDPKAPPAPSATHVTIHLSLWPDFPGLSPSPHSLPSSCFLPTTDLPPALQESPWLCLLRSKNQTLGYINSSKVRAFITSWQSPS